VEHLSNIGNRRIGFADKIHMDGFNGIAGFTMVAEVMTMSVKSSVG
jgi:hypothetical protein